MYIELLFFFLAVNSECLLATVGAACLHCCVTSRVLYEWDIYECLLFCVNWIAFIFKYFPLLRVVGLHHLSWAEVPPSSSIQ